MKLKTILLFVMLLLGTHLAGQAQTAAQLKYRIILQKKNMGAVIKRPKTPDMQIITCEYDGKGMSLNLVLPEGSSTMTVTDIQGEGGVYTIDTSALEVYVPVGELSYPIHVQLETETDKIYEGIFKE